VVALMAIMLALLTQAASLVPRLRVAVELSPQGAQLRRLEVLGGLGGGDARTLSTALSRERGERICGGEGRGRLRLHWARTPPGPRGWQGPTEGARRFRGSCAALRWRPRCPAAA
jgi:hypothetical protein